MKITLKKGNIENAPKGYVRISFTEKVKGAKRLVKEKGVETLEIGVGKFEELNRRKFIILCRSIIQAAKANKSKKIALQFDRTPGLFKNLKEYSREALARLTAENFEMANFEFT